MTHSYVIGIDIGTGSVKAVAVDLRGNVLNTAQIIYPASPLPPGEQEARVVFDVFKQCLRSLHTKVGSSPKAVSLSAAMHSLLAVDEHGEPLMNALLWSDTRSSETAKALRHTEAGNAIYIATGTPIHAMSPLCKLRWLKENEPAVFNKSHKFISLKEFIWHRLFGEYCIDHSIASATGLFNVHELRWHSQALAFAGISAEQLSQPVPTAYNRLGLSEAMTNELNLSANTSFYIGASDGCLANLGSGCLDASTAAITIGTSAAVRITSAQPLVDVERMIFNYRLDEQTFVCGGATNNGGNLLKWLLKTFEDGLDGEKAYEQLFAAVNSIEAGSKGLLFLPYLHGERAPVWDEESSGAYVGVKQFHTRKHFLRAALEGLCFALRDILEGLESAKWPVEKIKVSGGVASSKVFLQMLADVCGERIELQRSGDASAVGAAYLALKAMGAISDYTSLFKTQEEMINPIEPNVQVYDKLFTIYKKLYPSLKDAMHSLG